MSNAACIDLLALSARLQLVAIQAAREGAGVLVKEIEVTEKDGTTYTVGIDRYGHRVKGKGNDAKAAQVGDKKEIKFDKGVTADYPQLAKDYQKMADHLAGKFDSLSQDEQDRVMEFYKSPKNRFGQIMGLVELSMSDPVAAKAYAATMDSIIYQMDSTNDKFSDKIRRLGNHVKELAQSALDRPELVLQSAAIGALGAGIAALGVAAHILLFGALLPTLPIAAGIAIDLGLGALTGLTPGAMVITGLITILQMLEPLEYERFYKYFKPALDKYGSDVPEKLQDMAFTALWKKGKL